MDCEGKDELKERNSSKKERRKEKMNLNDCVFLKPNKPLLESFYIGRIVGFRKEEQMDQVQVAWFYRARDLNGRGDPRELIATMDCDWNPISSIHSKIVIKHSSQIKDFKEYKSADDCFYYDQLYDKYTKKFYKVVALDQANNLPLQYKELLQDTEFLLVEEKSQKKWTQRRSCASCAAWVNPTESNVICTNCRRGFHLDCVGLKKELPRKGYGWVCGICTREKEISDCCSDLTEFSDLSADDDEEVIVRTSVSFFKWPWRYFGDFSRFEDLFRDPEGRPKAGSRIGKSYQALDLPLPGSDIPVKREFSGKSLPLDFKEQIKVPVVVQHVKETPVKPRGRGRPRKSDVIIREVVPKSELTIQNDAVPRQNTWKRKDKRKISEEELLIPERGSSELIFSPDNISQDDLGNYLERIQKFYNLSSLNADLIYVSLNYLHTYKYNPGIAFDSITKRKLNDLLRDEWISQDIGSFEKCFVEYGPDLTRIKAEIPHKTMKEIVSFFYKWKSSPRYLPAYRRYCSQHKTKKSVEALQTEKISIASDFDVSSESEAESIEELPSEKIECGLCKIGKSEKWRIRYVPERVFLCMDCNLFWMKYRVPRPDIEVLKKNNADLVKKEIVAKRKIVEEPLVAKKKVIPKFLSPTPVERFGFEVEYEPQELDFETSEAFNERPCSICFENTTQDLSNPLMACSGCKLKVHRTCYGADTLEDQEFHCDRCINMKTPETSTDYTCIFCPAKVPKRLCAMKRTICNNWAHLTCALWIPEIKFSDPISRKIVECTGHIDPTQWAAVIFLFNRKHTCTICDELKGITIQCCERSCSNHFHIGCCSNNEKYLLILGEMRGDTSKFEPKAYCALHARKWRNKLISDAGVSLSQSHLLNQYVLENKKIPLKLSTTGEKRSYSLGLVDSCDCHVNSPIKSQKITGIRNSLQHAVQNWIKKSCITCHCQKSPFWWPIPTKFDADGGESEPSYECQKCKWKDQVIR